METLSGDITDPAVRQQAVERSVERFGGLDILINNAGVGAMGLFEKATAERLRRVMEVNFFALVEMTRAALPLKAGPAADDRQRRLDPRPSRRAA